MIRWYNVATTGTRRRAPSSLRSGRTLKMGASLLPHEMDL
jgi:hypothetical protein